MEYTGRRVFFTAREREDGQWRLCAWVTARDEDDGPLIPVQHAWKVVPLSFREPGWVLLALIQEALRYVAARNDEHLEAEDPEQLDLWADV